jgi:hypothetical protein
MWNTGEWISLPDDSARRPTGLNSDEMGSLWRVISSMVGPMDGSIMTHPLMSPGHASYLLTHSNCSMSGYTLLLLFAIPLTQR